MAVTYGFFNSVNGDRKYNADQMSEYFRGIVSQGVFQHLDSGMAVSAGTGLSVSVAAGRAIIQDRWIQNSAALNLTISAASETYGRKDAVVIRLDKSSRAISITVKTGTPAASPVAPSMTRNATTYEMALAYVNVAAGASSVTVTDKRSDSSVCGWASVAQATSGEVDQMLNDMKTGFDGVEYSSPAAMVQGCDELLSNSIELDLDYGNKLFSYKGNLLPLYIKRYPGKIINDTNGKLIFDNNSSYVSYIVRVLQNTTYHGTHFRYYALLESDGKTLIGSRGQSAVTFSTGNAYYAAFSFAPGDYPEETYVLNIGSVKTDAPTEINFKYSSLPTNNNNMLQSADVYLNTYYNTDYHTNASDYTVFVFPVTSGKSYTIVSKARYISKSGTVIYQNRTANYTYTADFTGDLYVTLYNEDRNGWAVYESGVPANHVPQYDKKYMDAMPDYSVLAGKTWYACGDSFTAGDFTGYSGQYRFTDMPYYGMNMVYPYFIGRRTGAIVKNIAVNGMTLAVVSGRTNDFISIYQNVGVDADYITLKFGINDGHQHVPIGEITDTSTSTFYGAWNTVLTWMINNRPQAKIGIIVSNGLDSNDYAEATINIAKKYGLPYLNEWNGEEVPVLIRSGRTDVDASIIQLRTDTWKVSNDNWHPNEKCHEYESTFVEEFLNRL